MPKVKQFKKVTLRGTLALGLAMLSFLGLTIAMPAHTYAAVTNPRPAAKVSFTFDDGYIGALQKAAPALAEYGMTGTEYVATGDVGKPGFMNWSQIAQLHNQYGWEIGSHTVTHPELTTVNATRLENELASSKAMLQSKGFNPTAFATPYGDYNEQVLAAIARHYGTHRPFHDTDGTNPWPYNESLLQVKQVQAGVSVAQVKTYINEAKQKNLWLVLVFHEIADNASSDPDEYQYRTADLREIAAYVKAQNMPAVNISKGTVTSTVNMLTNPGFDQGITAGWSTDNANQVRKNTARKGSFPSATNSIELTAASNKDVHLFSPKVDVVASNTYLLKSFLNVETRVSGEVTYYIDEYDQNERWISGQYKKGERSVFVENLNFTYKPSSSSVKKASLQIGVSANSGIRAYVDNVQWFSLN